MVAWPADSTIVVDFHDRDGGFRGVDFMIAIHDFRHHFFGYGYGYYPYDYYDDYAYDYPYGYGYGSRRFRNVHHRF